MFKRTGKSEVISNIPTVKITQDSNLVDVKVIELAVKNIEDISIDKNV